jgi:ABC-type sugar transport system ATPase subunit
VCNGRERFWKIHAHARDCGQLQPTSGDVLLNGQPLYQSVDALKRFLAYIPQDDAFDDHLTISENMAFAAAIRSPHLSRRDRSAASRESSSSSAWSSGATPLSAAR